MVKEFFLTRDHCRLMAEEEGMNLKYEVNPFIINWGDGKWAKKGYFKSGTTVCIQLRTVITEEAKKDYEEKKTYRKNMMKAKLSGEYDVNTYKKFKNKEKVI